MSKNTLYDKVFEQNTIDKLPNGQTQLFINTHLIHEVTSPQGFDILREKNIQVLCKDRTFATVDHIIPTEKFTSESLKDKSAKAMYDALIKNVKEFDVTFFNRDSKKQGIAHVVAPERGIIKPGSTVVCGDSHTSTHGAFGCIAFGIGSTEVGFVLATQTLPAKRLKVRKIQFEGTLQKGVTSKDLIMYLISILGVQGGVGFAYEFCGKVIEDMSMEARMSMCNMSIEAGARVGYINPDETTYKYLQGKEYAPSKDKWADAIKYYDSIKSDSDAIYDDVVIINIDSISPVVTFGVTPAHAICINDSLPKPTNDELKDAIDFMDITDKHSLVGLKIDVAFLGSCTNSRIEDLRAGAEIIKIMNKKVPKHVRFLVVPGSEEVKAIAEQEGIDKIYKEAGAIWREPGCSMCLGMNPDKLTQNQRCISSSNRNFKGRQGHPTGKTHLASAYTVTASALSGAIVNPQDFL
jgi:3-isopropylmalate/(R)-2-methylmalate dehydratase large subunit